MRVLVTGSNGFIGSAIVEYLINKHEVIGLGRSIENKHSRIKYVKFELGNDEVHELKLEDFGLIDSIIHTAAYVSKDNQDSNLIYSNIVGAQQILEIAQRLEVKQIIHTSSIPIIGKPQTLPINEHHSLNPKSLYHITKLTTEYILNLGINYGINVANLRIPSPIGPRMPMNSIVPIFVNKILNGEAIKILGKGERVQNYIDVRDIAEAVFLVLENKIEGVYNIASYLSHSNLELAKLCFQVNGSKENIQFSETDDPEADLIWNISIEKAVNQFGFKPKFDLVSSLKDIFKSQNKR